MRNRSLRKPWPSAGKEFRTEAEPRLGARPGTENETTPAGWASGRARDATSIIILYGPAEIPFTEKVRRGLLLKGLDFKLREPAGPEDYKRWSPDTGLLPVLEIDGERTHDSTGILLRLDELFPDPPLLAKEPQIAEMQQQLENWADESFLWYYLQYFRIRDAKAEEDTSNGASRLPGLVRWTLAWFRSGGTWERPETAIMRGLGDRMDDLVQFLGTRPFFYSDQVSMADLAVYSMLHSMHAGGIPGAHAMIVDRPSLIQFIQRVEEATDHPGA